MGAKEFIEWAVGIVMVIIILGFLYVMWKERLIERRKQGNWSRQKKRGATVSINGVEIKAIKAMRKLARKMPVMHNQETGKRIDHYKDMHSMYLQYGSNGINMYVNHITGRVAKQLQKQHGK